MVRGGRARRRGGGRRRRWPVVVLVVALVAAALAGGGWWLWSSGALGELAQLLSGDADDEGGVVTYGADAAVAVTSTTRVVLYGSEGDDPLEDYDVWLLGEDGTVEACHVDGDSFTMGSLGVGEGTYSLVAQDPDTSEVYSVGSVTVVASSDGSSEGDADGGATDGEGADGASAGDDAGETGSDGTSDGGTADSGATGSDDADASASEGDASDGASADEADDSSVTLYETVVSFRPAASGDDADGADGADDASTDSGGDSSTAQLAYLLYYQKVLELQATYGEASADEDDNLLEGLGVLLADLDADGLDELVVAYPAGDEYGYGSYWVEIWRYDVSALALDQACSVLTDYIDYYDNRIFVYEFEGTAYLWLHGSVSDLALDNGTLVFAGEDGTIQVYSCSTPHEAYEGYTTVYELNGSEISEEEALAYEELVDEIQDSCDSYTNYPLASYSYSVGETVEATEATIEAIAYGMFGMEVPEGDEATEDDADPNAAAYAAYYDLLLSYQESYGACSYETNETKWETHYELRGLCLAVLVDFDGDGTDELVCAYHDEGLGTSYDYAIQVWAYEDGLVSLYDSSESGYYISGDSYLGVRIATFGGRSYLVSGYWGGFLESCDYWGYEDGEFSVEVSLDYDPSDDYNSIYYVGGVEVSSEEYYSAIDGATYTSYLLMYWDSALEYSNCVAGSEALEETLATLSAYA